MSFNNHIKGNPVAVRASNNSGRADPRELFFGHTSKVAILIDADFFLRSYRRAIGQDRADNAKRAALDIWHYAVFHIDRSRGEKLYRIFVYDCSPLDKKWHHPISGRSIDYSKEQHAVFRKDLHIELVQKPFVALRKGILTEPGFPWKIKEEKLKALFSAIKDKKALPFFDESDVVYSPTQKGVDMKIGLDIAHLSHNKLVDKIVLISGDSDFVSAAKQARRAGIHFTLDALHNKIKPDLSEHIDQLTNKMDALKNWIIRNSKVEENTDISDLV